MNKPSTSSSAQLYPSQMTLLRKFFLSQRQKNSMCFTDFFTNAVCNMSTTVQVAFTANVISTLSSTKFLEHSSKVFFSCHQSPFKKLHNSCQNIDAWIRNLYKTKQNTFFDKNLRTKQYREQKMCSWLVICSGVF